MERDGTGVETTSSEGEWHGSTMMYDMTSSLYQIMTMDMLDGYTHTTLSLSL